MTSVYLLPDPAAATGIQMVQLLDDTPLGVTSPPARASLLTSEEQSDSADITLHPIETGAQISDNVRPEPAEVTYVFDVAAGPVSAKDSNATPTKVVLDVPSRPINFLSESQLLGAAIGAIGGLLFGSPTPSATGPVYVGYDPVATMHAALRAIMSAGATCDVVTTTGTLQNMLISAVKYSRKDAGGANFSVTLKQVFTVSSSTVDAPRPTQPRGQPAKSAGTQTPAPAAAPAPKPTTAAGLLGLGG